MSATDLSWLASRDEIAENWNSRRRKWWARFSSRCAGPDCPKLGRLWPSWLQKSEGVEFDSRWYCSSACLESVLAGRVYSLLSGFHQERPRARRFPIGLLLLSRGAVSRAQLREAIRLQRKAGHGRLGDWLQKTADLSVHQLTAALGQQWGCPVFPLDDQAVPTAWCDLVPLPVLESAAAVPAYASGDAQTLHIAFGERVDHTLLYAVEQMLGCRTFPCVAPAAAIAAQLDQFRRIASGTETSFDTIRESPEMTRTICNYATEHRAARLVLARASSFMWVRFFRDRSSRDLLFRILTKGHLPARERSSAALNAKAFLQPADGRKGGVSDAVVSL